MAEYSHNEKERITSEKKDEFNHARWNKAIKRIIRLVNSKELSAEEAGELAKAVEENLDIIEDGLREKDYFDDAFYLLRELAVPAPNTVEVSELAADALSRNLDFLEGKIESKRRNLNNQVFNAAVSLIDYGTAIQKKQGVDFLVRHFQDIDLNMREGHGSAYVYVIEDVAENGAPEDVKKALSILHDYVRNEEDYHILGECLRSFNSDMRKFAESIMEEKIGRYGLDSKKFLDAWSISDKKSFWGPTMSFNLRSLEYLEGQRPGIALFLNSEFGIYDFGRYPPGMLIKQYDEYEDTAMPYGVIFYPKNDHNGAFYGTNHVFGNLFSQTAGKYALRVVEGDSKIDIVKMLHRLDRKYGKSHKIQFAIIGGHGAPDCIQFGGSEAKHRLKISDLIDKRAKNKSRYFEKNPTIILNSCETGFREGMGQKLSKILNARVIGPDVKTNLKEIKVKFVGDKAEFAVEYLEKGVAQAYSSGQRS